mmetsp:Transcript_54545/g.145613  ORF Transcript_54545/g.145613 Transcript_54545/m.145613 type:complete len:93 (+) Transcript_54545:456-734(+)
MKVSIFRVKSAEECLTCGDLAYEVAVAIARVKHVSERQSWKKVRSEAAKPYREHEEDLHHLCGNALGKMLSAWEPSAARTHGHKSLARKTCP